MTDSQIADTQIHLYTFDEIVEYALVRLRELADTEGLASFQPTRVLVEAGLSHTDAERSYSRLKRLGLITILRHGRGKIIPQLQIDMQTSVATRLIERQMSHQLRRNLTDVEAHKAYLSQQIDRKRAELAHLERQLAQLEVFSDSVLQH